MNPFDLPGPQFLLFYLVLSSVVTMAVILLRRHQEAGFVPPPPLDDPYLIAFLRGGEDEALRVATMSLIDRGLLRVEESRRGGVFSSGESLVSTASENAVDKVKRSIEKEILQAFKLKSEVSTALEDLAARGVCESYRQSLTQMGLLPDENTTSARQRRYLVVVGILLGVALIKVFVALSRGRHNIWFLVLMAALFSMLASKVNNPFRTGQGDKLLADMRNLFASLKERRDTLRPGGATSELAWFASVFGLTAVSAALFPHIDVLQSRRRPQTSSSGFWHSSSCGSGCGGGCSGGCGGGCGGCGS